MPSISRETPLQTVITTFEMTPGTCHDLLDLLRAAYAEFISRQPGLPRRGAARQRRPDPDRQLLAVARARGFPLDAALGRDAPAQPRDRRALQELRAGDVRGGRYLLSLGPGEGVRPGRAPALLRHALLFPGLHVVDVGGRAVAVAGALGAGGASARGIDRAGAVVRTGRHREDREGEQAELP